MSFCGETRPFHLAQAPDSTDHTCSKDVEILFHDNHRAASLPRGTGQRPGAAAASHARPSPASRLRRLRVGGALCGQHSRGARALPPRLPAARRAASTSLASPGTTPGASPSLSSGVPRPRSRARARGQAGTRAREQKPASTVSRRGAPRGLRLHRPGAPACPRGLPVGAWHLTPGRAAEAPGTSHEGQTALHLLRLLLCVLSPPTAGGPWGCHSHVIRARGIWKVRESSGAGRRVAGEGAGCFVLGVGGRHAAPTTGLSPQHAHLTDDRLQPVANTSAASSQTLVSQGILPARSCDSDSAWPAGLSPQSTSTQKTQLLSPARPALRAVTPRAAAASAVRPTAGAARRGHGKACGRTKKPLSDGRQASGTHDPAGPTTGRHPPTVLGDGSAPGGARV